MDCHTADTLPQVSPSVMQSAPESSRTRETPAHHSASANPDISQRGKAATKTGGHPKPYEFRQSPHKPVATKKRKGFSPETIARLEEEMGMLERDFKAVETGYGQNVLHLTLAGAYVRKLLENVNVAAFLKASHGDIFAEFEKIVAADSLLPVP